MTPLRTDCKPRFDPKGTVHDAPENARLENWLAQESPEPVLEPALPIVDPHHHLWDLRTATTEPFLSLSRKFICAMKSPTTS